MHRNHNVLYAVILILLLAGGYGWLRGTDAGSTCQGAVAAELKSLSATAGDLRDNLTARYHALTGKKDVEEQH